ncbi:MAG: DEAD/DEAH box helicase family protein [Ignavibacteriales bacterium]
MDLRILENLKFKYPFRKHQTMLLEQFESLHTSNKNTRFKYHVVSPPGSGKTIAGIEMAVRLKVPALVMCPNTAIQGQWMDKAKMFIPEGSNIELNSLVSSSSNNLNFLNVFTYQSLSIPDNSDDSEIIIAENLWADTLSKSSGIPVQESLDRIYKMKASNPENYSKELSKYTIKLRHENLQDVSVDLFEILHPNAKSLIQSLKETGVKTMIFDECHHLQNYWALVMAEIAQKLEIENLIGLTATPPISDDKEKMECYNALLGNIDFQIPTPAVVKEGMLAPYQDLAYFCVPLPEEFEFIKNSHQKFQQITSSFDSQSSDFYFWISDRIINRKLVTGEAQEWPNFFKTRTNFAIAGVKYLLKNQCKLPWDITVTEAMYSEMSMDDWCALIEDYALNLLKISSKDEDKALYEEIREALRSLGYVLSENGIRAYSSPIDRILAYSKNKIESLKLILKNEMKAMGDKIRVAIITDFEFSNALSLKKMESLLDEESGGAIRVIKELTNDEEIDKLDPVMVTGSNLLCDEDLAQTFINLAKEWAEENSFEFDLSIDPSITGSFCSVVGVGKDWCSRTAVLFTTYIFEKGITKCIIGTRGLLGEGWDSINLNTLLDMSTVTTFASVNQLRGRSIRKSEIEPKKVANNWDIICIAPGLEKGYNDMSRLFRKHENFYGICDDSQIQCGINHLDGSLSLGENHLSAEEINEINQRMLSKSVERAKAYEKWGIGQPYENINMGCCELKLEKPIIMKAGSVYGQEQSILASKLKASIYSTIVSGVLLGTLKYLIPTYIETAYITGFLGGILGLNAYTSFSSFLSYGNEKFLNINAISSIKDISLAIFNGLKECGLVDNTLNDNKVVINERDDGTIRVHLEASEKDSTLFSASLSEMLSPISDQRYAVERYEVPVPKTSLFKVLYMVRYGLNKCPPVLMSYHPLPSAFNLKERAVVFQKYWNKFVSPGEVIFLKGEKGQKVLEKYGRINFLGAKKHVENIWR